VEEETRQEMSLRKAESVIEALLFTMGESISLEALSNVLELDKEKTRAAARQLMSRYQVEGRGIQIIELDGAFQMCTNPEMYDYIIKLTHQPRKLSLTGVMLETLAIIAYKQPVTRGEIEQIRGVSCQHAVNKLLEYGLIRESGRLNAPGRPILFSTTEDFLRTFGLSSVELLPAVSPEKMDSLKTEAEEEAGISAEEAGISVEV
jgi:segregation and condensation protein B